MPDVVNIALVGVGGYGGHYLEPLLNPPEEKKKQIRFVGAISRSIAKYPERQKMLENQKVPIYLDLDAFFAERSADLVVISSPIHFHCTQTCQALSHGANVLCEKPLAATVQEARQMMEAEQKSGKFVVIGYQWSFSTAIQKLKRDIMGGLFGRPICLKTLVLWPRAETYYGRNNWAGRLRTPDGKWVLDSPIHNATAHYLHNMFYLLGPNREAGAMPRKVIGELYHANLIENFDVGMLRCFTDTGVEILFYSTHAVSVTIGPVSHYEFENAHIYYGPREEGAQFIARFHDGTIRTYGNPDAEPHNKIWEAVETVHTGNPVACGLKAARSQLLCVNGLQDSMPEIIDFPESLIKVNGEPGGRQVSVRGLEETMIQCYDQGILPSEHGAVSWARPGRRVDLSNYRFYPGGTEKSE